MILLLYKPFYQTLFFFVITLLSLVFINPKAENLWTTSGVIFGIYILVSSLFIFIEPNEWRYFFTTLGFSLLYLVLLGVSIQLLISLRNIPGSNEGSMIFLLIIYHPISLLLCISIKWIVSIFTK